MIFSTTSTIQGQRVSEHCGVVVVEAVIGINLVRDIFARIRDVVGGRSASYEKELGNARETAFRELEKEARARGADAVIGIDIDYQSIPLNRGCLLLVSISGTAVKLAPDA